MTKSKIIRVLIVDDSMVTRSLLRAMLETDDQILVVGEAEDGPKAIAMTRDLRPNLVTMDLHMPGMGGVEAIREIMSASAVPILVVSGRIDAQLACEAIACGALDVLAKPDISQGASLVAKVKLLSGVPVVSHIRQTSRPIAVAPPDLAPMGDGSPLVFSIASSTGGPQALDILLASLPADFPCPIVVAQHISPGFSAGLADWLNSKSRLSVRLAKDGDVLRPAVVYICPSESNLTVTRQRSLVLEAWADGQIYHPSCDRLLSSVAGAFGKQAVGIILTGMGRDGVDGIASIDHAGGITLAQDEQSSIVFGMNGEAVRSGHVHEALPLTEIAKRMCGFASAPGRP